MARVASVRPTNFTLDWIRELTLRYTTPDIHCRHRRHECDGEIIIKLLSVYMYVYITSRAKNPYNVVTWHSHDSFYTATSPPSAHWTETGPLCERRRAATSKKPTTCTLPTCSDTPSYMSPYRKFRRFRESQHPIYRVPSKPTRWHQKIFTNQTSTKHSNMTKINK